MKRMLLIAVCALTLAASVSPALAGTTQSDLAHAPVPENLQIETYRNTSVGGTLKAADPEGELVTYTITTEPMKGTVELRDDGTFVYTPNENKKGKDYFGYKAADTEGNVSQEATVIIRIKKQKTAVTYDDMNGRAEGRDAVLLAENGVFVGQDVPRRAGIAHAAGRDDHGLRRRRGDRGMGEELRLHGKDARGGAGIQRREADGLRRGPPDHARGGRRAAQPHARAGGSQLYGI